MIFQAIKVGTSVILHFRVISTEKSITQTIFMFQGLLEVKRSIQGQQCKNIIF